MDQCLLDAIISSNDTETTAAIRGWCVAATHGTPLNLEAAEPQGAISRRIAAENEVLERSFVLTAHRPNFLLPYTYNSTPNTDAFSLINPDQPIDSAEVQFQLSFKFPLTLKFLSDKNDLFFAFTSRAWWQAYNSNLSSPFRETDYEPELFVRHYGGPKIGPINIAGWDVGVTHQSNGQSEPLSRSWSRINASLALEFRNLALALHGWHRLPENPNDDDNPYLYQYLGYGDVRFLYNRRSHIFSAMFRPGTLKNTFELTWSLPLWQQLRLYFVYFDGYGESLVDYNHRNKRMGIGIGLNDYLDGSVITL